MMSFTNIDFESQVTKNYFASVKENRRLRTKRRVWLNHAHTIAWILIVITIPFAILFGG